MIFVPDFLLCVVFIWFINLYHIYFKKGIWDYFSSLSVLLNNSWSIGKIFWRIIGKPLDLVISVGQFLLISSMEIIGSSFRVFFSSAQSACAHCHPLQLGTLWRCDDGSHPGIWCVFVLYSQLFCSFSALQYYDG